MKVLLVGGSKIERASEAVAKMAGIDPITAKTVSTIKEYGSAGVRVERIILFEQAITNDGIYIDKQSIRKRTQEFIGAIKESFENFDLVCAADNTVVKQSMLEEVFELKSRACVIYCKDNRMSTSTLAALLGETILTLVEQYRANEVDKSIYRDVSSVKWSSEIEHETAWDNGAIASTHNLVDRTNNVWFNEKTGRFEELPDENNNKSGGVEQKSVAEEAKKPKRSWFFGNKKL